MILSGTPVAKAAYWKEIDAETRKLGERSRLETCVVLAVNECLLAAWFFRKEVPCGEANALSRPPGKYDRKVKTQRNWRGGTQPEEHVA